MLRDDEFEKLLDRVFALLGPEGSAAATSSSSKRHHDHHHPSSCTPAVSATATRRPLLVAICGVPGSGKTTLANTLVAALNEKWSSTNTTDAGDRQGDRRGAPFAVNVPMDGYHLPRSALAAMPNAEEAFARRGAEWTFDPAKLLRDLHTLRSTRRWSAPAFDHAAKDPVDDAICVTEATEVVVVEGLYLALRSPEIWADVNRQFDLCVFLDCPLEVATERLIRRHMAAWGISRNDAELRALGSDRKNAELVLTTAVNADLVVHSDVAVERR